MLQALNPNKDDADGAGHTHGHDDGVERHVDEDAGEDHSRRCLDDGHADDAPHGDVRAQPQRYTLMFMLMPITYLPTFGLRWVLCWELCCSNSRVGWRWMRSLP